MKPAPVDRFNVQFSTSAEAMAVFRQTQDLVSGKNRRPCTLEEMFLITAKEFVARHDPVEKAARAENRAAKAKNQAPEQRVETREPPETENLSRDRFSRKNLPAALVHSVDQRDRRKCQAVKGHGRCNSTRWLNYHHIVPIDEGGTDCLENLITLCSACHREWHRRTDGQRSLSDDQLELEAPD